MNKRALRRNTRTAQIASLVAILNFVFPQHAQMITASAEQPEVAKQILLEQVLPGARISARVASLPRAADKPARKSMWLTVTAYSSSRDETDGDPFTAASGMKVHDGMVAYNYLPFGTKVRFPDVYGNKVFTIEDRMNPRHGRFVADMWKPSKAEAKQWGARVVKMEIL